MANINLTLEESKSLVVDRDFRQDINLLRGIAILSVVLYHFAPTLLPGGFIGVDVFFVISGFLMTKIIATSLEKRSFNLIQFYAARSKRIIPALLILCLVLSLVTLFWLPTNEYRKLGNYIGYTVLFISNIKLKKESGDYFATDSHENWFLHTWSLSVEWQFYLVLPFIIMALYPFRKKVNTGLCLLLLTLGAFWFSMNTSVSAATRFYLMPYRAWEMLCGSLIWYSANRYVLSRTMRTIMALLGYGLITGSIFFISAEHDWPGGITILPIIGTMLVIYSNNASLISLADRNLRWIGLSSYSIYLWHWPIAVYLTYSEHQHNGLWVVSAIALSFLLGWVSWVLIEQPAKNFLNQRAVASFWIILFTCVGGAWGYSHLVKNEIIVSHPNAQVDRIAAEANNKNYSANPKTHMSYYGTGEPAVIIIGDSHAEATATALAEAAKERGSVVGITYSGCPTLANANLLGSNHCGKFNRSLSKKLQAYPANVPVVIVNRLTHYAENKLVTFETGPQDNKDYLQHYQASIVEMACTLNRDHPVVLVNPVPEMEVNVPRTLSHRLMTSKKTQDISIPLVEYQKRNSAILQAQSQAAKNCGVRVLDPTPYLCKAGHCIGSKNLEPQYFDDNHLSETGNKALVPMFKQIFADDAHST
ncbi:acyltransferase [Pantoea sp. LS15]|uniref:acyltransferase family protein n=1 Tax=Enterobacterales TaxID=91347 RepID=UPI000E0F4266|nr:MULTISPECIES: acyltransferase family protein [Enterobacterales]NJQ20678.1 acyltransferase [Pantoea sp. LS15]NKF47274.1 acyltransferase [Pantoea sp. LS15]RDK14058.1 acyltransferase [Enterobacter sp. 9-2]